VEVKRNNRSRETDPEIAIRRSGRTVDIDRRMAVSTERRRYPPNDGGIHRTTAVSTERRRYPSNNSGNRLIFGRYLLFANPESTPS